MNEVTVSVNASQVMAGTASSKGAVQAQSVTGGKKLPEPIDIKERINAAKTSIPPKEGLESAVARMNDYVQSIQRDLQFTVDEDLEKTIVKVIDSNSGEIIRQIPDAVFLELARKLKEDGELQLVDALG